MYYIGITLTYRKCSALYSQKSKGGADVPTMFYLRGSPKSSENNISGHLSGRNGGGQCYIFHNRLFIGILTKKYQKTPKTRILTT